MLKAGSSDGYEWIETCRVGRRDVSVRRARAGGQSGSRPDLVVRDADGDEAAVARERDKFLAAVKDTAASR